MDLITTYIGLINGAIEQNPVVTMFGHNLLLILSLGLLIKIVGIITICFLPVIWKNTAALLIGLSWLIFGAINNIIVLHRMSYEAPLRMHNFSSLLSYIGYSY